MTAVEGVYPADEEDRQGMMEVVARKDAKVRNDEDGSLSNSEGQSAMITDRSTYQHDTTVLIDMASDLCRSDIIILNAEYSQRTGFF